MKTGLKASSARRMAILLSAGCLAGISTYGCTSNSESPLAQLLISDAPDQVAVAPTLAPVQPNTTTPITTPNFGAITPPPFSPSLPARPSGSFSAVRPENTNRFEVAFSNLRVRGTIRDVRVQVLNVTCGSDVTGVLAPNSLEQFRRLLIGRGNTFEDAEGFDFSYIFATNPSFFRNGLIGEGNDIVFSVIITDQFNQVLQLDSSVGDSDAASAANCGDAPGLPAAPALADGGSFNADQPLASIRYDISLMGLQVPGGIADVNIQALNITCGTDVTGVLNASAVAQFKSALIGRGLAAADADGFDFMFIFPTNPAFFRDGRILSKAEREIIVGVGEDGQPETETRLTGDDVVIVITITDSFGQVLRVDDSIFGEGETRTEVGCGTLVFPARPVSPVVVGVPPVAPNP